MKRFILVDDFIKELNEKHRNEMTDFCLTPLGVETWLNDRAMYPAQLLIYSKERPDPELDDVITHLTKICKHYESINADKIQTYCFRKAIAYLWQLSLLKGEYARVFFEERKSPE